MIKEVILGTLTLILMATSAFTQPDLKLHGGKWDFKVSSNDVLIVGEDFSGPFESPVDETIFEVKGYYDPGTQEYNVECINNGNCNWKIEVKKIDNVWHNDLSLFIRRTSNNSNVNNGTLWQEITNVSTPFIDGIGNAYNINIQFYFSGVSVLIPSDQYKTNVYYTIFDI